MLCKLQTGHFVNIHTYRSLSQTNAMNDNVQLRTCYIQNRWKQVNRLQYDAVHISNYRYNDSKRSMLLKLVNVEQWVLKTSLYSCTYIHTYGSNTGCSCTTNRWVTIFRRPVDSVIHLLGLALNLDSRFRGCSSVIDITNWSLSRNIQPTPGEDNYIHMYRY